jgi:hypothetical protein
MAHNLIDAVNRLAKMQEHDRQQLEKMNAEWERMMGFCYKRLEETRKGLDDIAAMLGIIEPQTSMPMLPANPGSGPQPAVTFTPHEPATGHYCDGCGITIGHPGLCAQCQRLQDDLKKQK